MFHQACGTGVDSLLIRAMKVQSLDNLSIVMIGLKGFRNALEKAWDARQNQGNLSQDIKAEHNRYSSNPITNQQHLRKSFLSNEIKKPTEYKRNPTGSRGGTTEVT